MQRKCDLPTTPRIAPDGSKLPIEDAASAMQLGLLKRNAPEFGIRYIDAPSPQQGNVHVVGPEQAFSLSTFRRSIILTICCLNICENRMAEFLPKDLHPARRWR